MKIGGALVGTVAVFLLAMLAGCSSGPRVVKVSGTVTRAGRPVGMLVVNFTPEKGRPSSGLTDKEGHYTLKYDRGRLGAVTGRHKVWFKVQVSNPKEESDREEGVLKLRPEVSAILQKYGDEKMSPLTALVQEDDQVINLPLD
jgi:hypothetical protein